MAVWIALIVWAVLVVAGLVFACLRGYQLFRQAQRTGSVFDPELERISKTSERIQVHLERAERSGKNLEEAANRLAISRSRLDLQLAAIREAQRAINTVIPLFGQR